MKLDVLVFASHPDDAELGCGGTILSLVNSGKKVGIIDLTEGEMGTRGTVQDRRNEAAAASAILNLSVRENLGLEDGNIQTEDQESVLKVIEKIRKYQPDLLLANAHYDRHPDHGAGAKLVSRAAFLSGLIKIETQQNGQIQAPWRPKKLYHYIQDRYIRPDFIVDVSPFWEQKIEAIKAYKSQFHTPENQEPETYISKPDFLYFVESRSREFGHNIETTFGEGFTTDKHRMVGVKDIFDLL